MPLALVTGASRGIGRDTALRLAAAGYTVGCLARSRADLEALAASRPGLVPVVADVTDAAALEGAVRALLSEHGPCAVLVNNAGYGLRAAVEEIPLDAWRRQFEVNLFSCARVVQLVLPGMRAAGRGCVVNVSSVAGRIATPFSGAYCATKFALEAMSDALRLEVAPFGVHVVLVEPGPVRTDFMNAAGEVSAGIVTRSESPYAAAYRALLAGLDDLHRGAWASDAVAERIVAAALSPSPPARVLACGVTLRAAVALRGVWPGLLDRLARRRLGPASHSRA